MRVVLASSYFMYGGEGRENPAGCLYFPALGTYPVLLNACLGAHIIYHPRGLGGFWPVIHHCLGESFRYGERRPVHVPRDRHLNK